MSDVKTITDLFDYLPHRYPFLLLDRVTEVVKGEFIRGYKNVTFNEPMFTGHFPEQPIMPGVLILKLWRRFPEFWPLRQWVHAPKMGVIISLAG